MQRDAENQVGRGFLVLGKQFTEGNGPWSISVWGHEDQVNTPLPL